MNHYLGSKRVAGESFWEAWDYLLEIQARLDPLSGGFCFTETPQGFLKMSETEE